MREFKFRAWSKLGKHMFEVNAISQKAVEEMRDGMSFRYARAEVVLMQSTGLPDSNGVEIYEGDIARWFSETLPISRCKMHARFLIGNDLLTKGAALDSEVIGNLYDNPELLE